MILDALLLLLFLVAWGAQVTVPLRLAAAAPAAILAAPPTTSSSAGSSLPGSASRHRLLWSLASFPLALAGGIAALALADRNPDAAIAAHLVPLLASTPGALLAVLAPALIAGTIIAGIAGMGEVGGICGTAGSVGDGRGAGAAEMVGDAGAAGAGRTGGIAEGTGTGRTAGVGTAAGVGRVGRMAGPDGTAAPSGPAGDRLLGAGYLLTAALGLAACAAAAWTGELLRAGEGPPSSQGRLALLAACRLALALAGGELLAPGRPLWAVAGGIALLAYLPLLPDELRHVLWSQGLPLTCGAGALLLLLARWLPRALRRPALAAGLLLGAVALAQAGRVSQALAPGVDVEEFPALR
jgi:hypothetical protein